MATATEVLRPDPPVRDPNGDLSLDFLAAVAQAVAARDAFAARKLAGALHEADVGDRNAALEPEERTRFIGVLGDDFDFAALTELDDTVRAQILEEMPAETVAEGVRDLESDDAVSILEDL